MRNEFTPAQSFPKDKLIHHVNDDTILRAIDFITDHPESTRRDIARALDVSVMTAGHIADALLLAKIACESPSPRKGAGRPAGVLAFDPYITFAVFDLSGKEFIFKLFDLSLKVVQSATYRFDGSKVYDSNLMLYVNRCILSIIKNPVKLKLASVGVILPHSGLTDMISPGDSSVSALFQNMFVSFQNKLPMPTIFYVDRDISLGARSVASRVKRLDEIVMVYWHISEKGSAGIVFDKGSIVTGYNARHSDISNMLTSSGKTVGALLSSHVSLNTLATELSFILAEIEALLDPQLVAIVRQVNFLGSD